ncbi:uncharacterized protein [Spinacia oleracea]|uniref:DUF4218 domain-containing protein n=1 Tax=Spinacia oleracea TaxID=3562 RepID=A0ABM3QQA6_SPIOL|nr:uncharacterized protein LOC130461462 [Spinacia oleracea]
MSALLKLLHIKTLGRWTNESFTMLLDFLKEDLLPKGSNLPKSYNKSKKVMKDLGLSYQKIDACVNDCMLYWKENEKLNACDICGASRWKSNKHNGEEKCKSNGKRIPQKTLRYFPLKPRLQRLFMCSKTASLMTWHHVKKKKGGTMRHPVDGTAWESFDTEHPNFASDPRNVRLGLASDGFQPFANSKTSYSIWPVILIPYNVPPELCMKQSNMILSMLIPGPKGPGDAIDVYLQPLIEELKDLWEVGVETFDAATQRHFQLRAALMWTINDFPAYAMLSVEREGPPQPSSIDDILNELEDLENIILSKDPSVKTKISHEVRRDTWNKKKLKVPDGFSSNISYCVNSKEAKISGLKSHDCHVILEHLLPLAIRGLLTPLVLEALIELSLFFTLLCAKVLNVDDLKQLESQIPITLCKLEKVFPPSFFDVMMHLPIHLANEAIMGGPVQCRWMYPIEQYMYKLKSYIRNRAHPEASIAEGYVAEECMNRCSRYMQSIETRFNRLDRNYENSQGHDDTLPIFSHSGRSLGDASVRDLEKGELDDAHIYILKNCDEVQPFLREYSEIQALTNPGISEEEWCKNFKSWLKMEVLALLPL